MTQIKEILKTGLFAIIVLCGTAACSNDDNDIEIEVEDTSYTFDDIEWAISDNGVEVREFEIPEEIYKNETDSEMSITVCAVKNFTQSSTFYSNNPEYFQLLAQSPIDVFIPSGDKFFNGFFHVSGGPEVPFSLENYTYPPHSYSTHSFKVPPHTTITFKAIVTESKVTATYRAHVTGNNSNKQVDITGKWEGTYYTSNNSVFKTKQE
ncbi:MAG: hypothetical protein LUH50_05100 [Bacteroides intestinalis]|nr:hypothetical protein [Bacteroides intestinalis]